MAGAFVAFVVGAGVGSSVAIGVGTGVGSGVTTGVGSGSVSGVTSGVGTGVASTVTTAVLFAALLAPSDVPPQPDNTNIDAINARKTAQMLLTL
ncbi:hypothetical protein [Congzhengia sp.]|uniref:hypothetical protein n=1 Tax=Congzhengia sp. TaxID=2944168 RepID=UPI003077A0FB